MRSMRTRIGSTRGFSLSPTTRSSRGVDLEELRIRVGIDQTQFGGRLLQCVVKHRPHFPFVVGDVNEGVPHPFTSQLGDRRLLRERGERLGAIAKILWDVVA